MDYPSLRSELLTDPLSRGYSGMTAAAAAEALNAVDRPTVRTVIPAHEVIEATVAMDWATLSVQEKQRYALLTGAGEINAAGTNTRAAFQAMFGVGTTTRANLAALQDGPPTSRAAELGLPRVGAHHVATARAGPP